MTWCGDGDTAAVDRDRSSGGGDGSVEATNDLAASAAEHPCQADDLTGLHSQVDTAEVGGVTGQPDDFECGAGLATLDASRRAGRRRIDAGPEHQLDQFRCVEFGYRHGCHVASVPKDGDAISEYEHLVEMVGDVEDGDTRIA